MQSETQFIVKRWDEKHSDWKFVQSFPTDKMARDLARDRSVKLGVKQKVDQQTVTITRMELFEVNSWTPEELP